MIDTKVGSGSVRLLKYLRTTELVSIHLFTEIRTNSFEADLKVATQIPNAILLCRGSITLKDISHVKGDAIIFPPISLFLNIVLSTQSEMIHSDYKRLDKFREKQSLVFFVDIRDAFSMVFTKTGFDCFLKDFIQ